MTIRLVLALAVVVLAAAGGARAIISLPWPSSEQPVWLANGVVRFTTNLRTHDPEGEPYVVAADGSGLRPASPDEAAASAAPTPPDEQIAFGRPIGFGTPLQLETASGSRVLVGDASLPAGAALSPDGSTVVFGQWVGWAYAEGYALYAIPADGSTPPHRLTPTPCTVDSSTRSALRGRCFDGTDDADRITGTSYGDIVISGSGDDTIDAGNGQNVIEAQWGDDRIRSGPGPDEVWAGDGDDAISSGAGSDRIVAGAGHDRVNAGPGVDYVWANDGERDVIDCGPGDDRAIVDRFDVVRHCEHVIRRAAGPAPSP